MQLAHQATHASVSGLYELYESHELRHHTSQHNTLQHTTGCMSCMSRMSWGTWAISEWHQCNKWVASVQYVSGISEISEWHQWNKSMRLTHPTSHRSVDPKSTANPILNDSLIAATHATYATHANPLTQTVHPIQFGVRFRKLCWKLETTARRSLLPRFSEQRPTSFSFELLKKLSKVQTCSSLGSSLCVVVCCSVL